VAIALRDRDAQRPVPGGSPRPLAYAPGGDPLHPLRGLPRAWAARIPSPGPRGTAGPRREGLM